LPASAAKPATKASIKILYGESDEKVLATHTAEFKTAGHQVTTAVHRQGVAEALRRGEKFDLVILGSTLSKDDRHHLPYMVKKSHEGTRVLVMHAASRHHEVDASIDADTSMHFVLEKIAKLMAETKV
jgi:DNA-binding NtrC family response regulator